MFASRFDQPTRTPRGVPVEPEVNWSSASSAGRARTSSAERSARGSHACAGRSRRASWAASPTIASSAGSQATSAGAAAARIAAVRRRYCWRSGKYVGGATGVGVAPTHSTAVNVATKLGPLVYTSATTSPLLTPASRSHPLVAATRAASSSYECCSKPSASSASWMPASARGESSQSSSPSAISGDQLELAEHEPLEVVDRDQVDRLLLRDRRERELVLECDGELDHVNRAVAEVLLQPVAGRCRAAAPFRRHLPDQTAHLQSHAFRVVIGLGHAS